MAAEATRERRMFSSVGSTDSGAIAAKALVTVPLSETLNIQGLMRFANDFVRGRHFVEEDHIHITLSATHVLGKDNYTYIEITGYLSGRTDSAVQKTKQTVDELRDQIERIYLAHTVTLKMGKEAI